MFNIPLRACAIFLSFIFISKIYAQNPNQFGFVTGTCKFSGGDTVTMPFFYRGQGYPVKILDVPTLEMNFAGARHSLPDDYQDSCLSYFFHGCKLYKVFKEFDIPPMESIASAMSYDNLRALNELMAGNVELVTEIARYSIPSPLITRFNNLTCLPGGKIDNIPNNPNPQHVPHPNDVLPVDDNVVKPYLQPLPQYQPSSPRFYVPNLDEVINYLRENWDGFSWALTFALIGALAVYVGVNGVPAVITGGASLPSFGASAPILAAVLVAILIKHGAWNYSNSQQPTASADQLIIEIDEEKNVFILDGTVNGIKLNHHEIDLEDIQSIYQQIKQARTLQDPPTAGYLRNENNKAPASRIGF